MSAPSKRALSEQEIRDQYITPALHARWDRDTQVGVEVPLTQGKILVRGRAVGRGESKRADYVLYYQPNLPIAVVEAKDNRHSIDAGMQQGLVYAEMIDVPFVYSSNGDGFLEHDRTGATAVVERQLALGAFPSPEELWKRYRAWKKIDPATEPVITQPYHSGSEDKAPRYYQVNAVNRVVEAVAAGRQRALLVMATGTGKTFTAFQILWRLWKAGVKKRILFLADREALIGQTRRNDFKPFGGAMTRIEDRKVDKAYEIYLALYQAISSSDDSRDLFKQFSPTFFDLIVVDECHRGSAAANSAWREILEYFGSATQIGLTATPKETEDVSTTHYFGEPIYTYSLKQGIEDGYLAPYKVVRIDLDKDLDGWRPEKGKRDKLGQEIEDRLFEQKDFDRSLVIDQRTELVARKTTELLKATDRFAKTIVFCEDINHAERMRHALVNENGDLAAANRKYVMQMTGDNQEGKDQIGNFCDPEEKYPVVVTTSKLLSTGVDVQTCKVIVLDQNIRSPSEFKQIIGRGTRVREDHGKLYFTILDFRGATELFADPAFDGEPVQIYVPKPGESPVPPEPAPPEQEGGEVGAPPASREGGAPEGEGEEGDEGDGLVQIPKEGKGGSRRVKYVVGDVPVYVVAERVQYYGKDGSLISETLREYVRAALRERLGSLEAFRGRWAAAESRQAFLKELAGLEVFFEELGKEVGAEYGVYDLVAHVAFDQALRTRRERAEAVRKGSWIGKYGAGERAVLEGLLEKYENEGVEDVGNLQLVKVPPISGLGTATEILQRFGGREGYVAAVRGLAEELYAVSGG